MKNDGPDFSGFMRLPCTAVSLMGVMAKESLKQSRKRSVWHSPASDRNTHMPALSRHLLASKYTLLLKRAN